MDAYQDAVMARPHSDQLAAPMIRRGTQTLELTTHTPRGVDKVSRYGWVMKDAPGELRMLHKDTLEIHPAYQRDVIPAKVKAISAAWSWLSLGALVVAEREGKFWLVDGMHRGLAAKRRSDITYLPCVVFKTEDIKEEARAFLDLNTGRKPVTSAAKFKAMVAAEDEIAVFVQQMCDSLGLKVSTYSKNARQIQCIAWCIKRANESREAFSKVLALAAELAAQDQTYVAERVLEGLWVLHARCGAGLNDQRLVKRLRDKGARVLLDAANKAAAYYANGGGKVWAQGMLAELNKGLHHKFTLDGAEA